MTTHKLNFLTKTLIAMCLILSFASCSNEDSFQTRELAIFETYVEINGQVINFNENKQAFSDNYNVSIYDGMIHVVSLNEYFIKIDSVNQPYSILEEGIMYFILSDSVSKYPMVIKFTVVVD